MECNADNCKGIKLNWKYTKYFDSCITLRKMSFVSMLIELHVCIVHKDPEHKTDIISEWWQSFRRETQCLERTSATSFHLLDICTKQFLPRFPKMRAWVTECCRGVASSIIVQSVDDRAAAALIHLRHSKQHGTFLKSL